MTKSGARAIFTMPSMIVVAYLFFSLNIGPAYGQSPSAGPANAFHQTLSSKFGHDIRCTDLGSDSSLCSLRTELRYRNYLNTPLPSNARFFATDTGNDQPRMDLLSVFKLALEEFDLLSGVRIYWDYTERNIEQWAIRLKLKGEISISDPNYHENHIPLERTTRANHDRTQKSLRPTGLLALLTPQDIRWNIGMNPDDLTVFGDFHINRHLSISGEYGQESNVGVYFRYNF